LLGYSKNYTEIQRKNLQNTGKRNMRDNLREKLNTEITRKQFLEYLAAAVLALFGLSNLLSLLSGAKPGRTIVVHDGGSNPDGFGSRKFGK